MDRKIRLHQNNLVTSGWGLIILGVWPIIQTIMLFFLIPEEFNFMLQSDGIADVPKTFFIVSYLLLTILDVLFRVFAGRAAIKLGLGKKRAARCIVLSFIVLFVTIISVLGVFRYSTTSLAEMDNLIFLIISFFSIFVNIKILISAFYIQEVRKKQLRSEI